MDYQLIRTQRKTLAIYVKDCRVVVRAPWSTSVRDIERFLAFKRDWIEKHLAAQRESAALRSRQPPLDARQIRFYREQAGKIIPGRVAYYAPLLGVRPSEIRIGSAKKSWGSCSASGRLTFSWRLMTAPPDAVDYVVVHELAHLKQLNHSKRFWEIVSLAMPDWKDRRSLLRLSQDRTY